MESKPSMLPVTIANCRYKMAVTQRMGGKKAKKNYRKRRKGLLSLLYILICMFFILDEARFLREHY